MAAGSHEQVKVLKVIKIYERLPVVEVTSMYGLTSYQPSIWVDSACIGAYGVGKPVQHSCVQKNRCPSAEFLLF